MNRNRILGRMSLGSLFAAVCLFLMACTDYGQLGCDGHCSHPWDGTPGSCPQAGAQEGAIGGGCAGWPSNACVTGGRCIDGTCLACGADDQICCSSTTIAGQCAGGTCASSDNYGKCDTSCGTLTPGHDNCCAGNGVKCSEGACNINTNKCESPTSDPCTGNNPYFVSLVDAFGCATTPFHFTADDDAQANMCVQAMISDTGASGSCGLKALPIETDVCGSSFLMVHTDFAIFTCDAAHEMSCQTAQCTNCTFTAGQCP